MRKGSKKTGPHDSMQNRPPHDDEDGHLTPIRIRKKTSFEGISTKQRAYLEILGFDKKKKFIELGEGVVIIGREPKCGIQLLVKDVSRRHARIGFCGKDYQIEDLKSTNGTYVNGIKVLTCVLRNQDQIEIGGVRILFNEEKITYQK
jgi:pSer/pThr/pTyr-binding forkhead associated (FHA) protein